MVVNQKAVKVINKIFEVGITEEKEISAMTWTRFWRFKVLRLQRLE